MTTIDDILLNAEEQMLKTTEFLAQEFSTVRTGRASPALVENMNVEAYEGTSMKLRELASITSPEPRLLVIQPWDAATVDPIRKAIESSQLGISPRVDGKLIRIPFPELSQERREELVKVIKKMAEEQRVGVRHARRDAMDATKKLEKEGKVPEDDAKVADKEIQKITDQYIANIDKQFEAKEKELMKV